MRDSYAEVKNSSKLKRKSLVYFFNQFKTNKNPLIKTSEFYKELSDSESRYRLLGLIESFEENRIVKKIATRNNGNLRKHDGFNLELMPPFIEVLNKLNFEGDMNLILDMHKGKKRKFRQWISYHPSFEDIKKVRDMTIGYLGQDILIYFLESEVSMNIRKVNEDLKSSGREVKKWFDIFENLDILIKNNRFYSLNLNNPFVKLLGFFWFLDCLYCIFYPENEEEIIFTNLFLGNELINNKEFSSIFQVFTIVLTILSSKIRNV